MKTIGQMIKKRRAELGLSTRAVEKLINNPATGIISRYENELVHPSFRCAAKLSIALGFSLDKLARNYKP